MFPVPPFRQRIKPPRGAKINWDQAVARGLGFYCNFDSLSPTPGATGRQFAHDKVSGVTQIANAVGNVTASEFDLGVAAALGSGASASFIFGTTDTIGTLKDIAVYCLSNSIFTVAAKVMTRASSASTGEILAQNASISWQLLWNGNRLEFDVADIAQAVSNNNYNDGQWYTIFGVHIPGQGDSILIYDKSGNQLENVSVTASTVDPTAEPISIGSDQNGGSTRGHNNEWCGIWKRALEQSEMASLAADPYQILQPVRQRIIIPFSSAAPSGAMVGSATLTLGASGTMTGAGALVGSATITLTSGTTTISGAGALVGSAALTLATGTTTIKGAGALAGSSSITLSASGTMAGAGAVAGTATIVLGSSATLAGAGAVAGSGSITLGGTGTISGAGALAGTGTITLDGTGTLSGSGSIAGTATIIFGATGAIQGLSAGQMQGTATLTLGASATVSGSGSLAGTGTIVLNASGALNGGTGAMVGFASFSLSASASLGFTIKLFCREEGCAQDPWAYRTSEDTTPTATTAFCAERACKPNIWNYKSQ